jgi:Fe-S oxidoreductase
MPLPTGDVIGILADNLRLRRSVLPISKRNATRWARGLELPLGGETVLYTGMMYQLIPYIEGLVKKEKSFGDSFLARFTGIARVINKLVNVSFFMVRPSAKLRDAYNQVPIDVATLLKNAGIEFGYLYNDDLYSGALAYDLGTDETVAAHALKVHAVLKKHGVKSVITIDPHTTNMLRSVYPRLVPGYDIQVKTYLEVLAEKDLTAVRPLERELVLHDPCVFARYENVVDEPRKLLAAAGVSVKEPERSVRMTWCCGGPVESLYPEKAAANARKRVEQLRQAGSEVVTMCPMCLINLGNAAPHGVTFNDISHYLHRAFVD